MSQKLIKVSFFFFEWGGGGEVLEYLHHELYSEYAELEVSFRQSS